MKLIVTGFGPFPGVAINPTELLVRGIAQHGALPPWIETSCEVLPVKYDVAGSTVASLLENRSPDVLLLLGVKSAGSGVSLERFALNMDDSTVPDAAGVVRQGQAIRDGGSAALQTRVDLLSLRNAMAARSYALDISNHAGTYLCNHVYYRALDCAATAGLGTRVLFVHVPMPAEMGGDVATMSLDYLKELLSELLTHLCQTADVHPCADALSAPEIRWRPG